MTLDIVMAVVMCAALLWWIGRGLSTRSMLLATAVTLAVIAGVMLVQNHWPR
jgi:low affinity Fe/Cu permease